MTNIRLAFYIGMKESDIMQNKRILEIVRILLQQSDYITIQAITQILQVSNKTIRNDLMIVAEYLEESNLSASMGMKRQNSIF